MKRPIKKNLTFILQPAIQIKGGIDDVEDLLEQIHRNDPTFSPTKYLKEKFGISDEPLESDIIHLPPFKK